MCKRLCGYDSTPANPNEARWYRKRHYENHGFWPKTDKQRAAAEAEARAAKEAPLEEPTHPVASTQFKYIPGIGGDGHTHLSRMYDNDGRPIGDPEDRNDD
jgi:ribonuclease I